MYKKNNPAILSYPKITREVMPVGAIFIVRSLRLSVEAVTEKFAPVILVYLSFIENQCMKG